MSEDQETIAALRAALHAVMLDWMTYMPHDKLDLPSAKAAVEVLRKARGERG